jgi:uncharacterized membrane protein SpoIIM required for sporulation
MTIIDKKESQESSLNFNYWQGFSYYIAVLLFGISFYQIKIKNLGSVLTYELPYELLGGGIALTIVGVAFFMKKEFWQLLFLFFILLCFFGVITFFYKIYSFYIIGLPIDVIALGLFFLQFFISSDYLSKILFSRSRPKKK